MRILFGSLASISFITLSWTLEVFDNISICSEKLSYWDDNHGRIQTRDSDLSADTGPQNTFETYLKYVPAH